MRDELIISNKVKLVRVPNDVYKEVSVELSRFLDHKYRESRSNNSSITITKKSLDEMEYQLNVKLKFNPNDIIAMGTIEELKTIICKHIPSYPDKRAEHKARYHCYGNPDSKNVIHHDQYSSYNCIVEMLHSNSTYAIINNV